MRGEVMILIVQARPPDNRCARCDYDLSGLPTPHTCPECGHPFDAETVTWRPRRQLWLVAVDLGSVLIAIVVASVTHWSLLWVPLVFGGWSLGIGVLRRLALNHRQISVGPAGILVTDADTHFLTWDEIQPIDEWRFPDLIGFRSHRPPMGISDLFPHYDSVYEFRECVRKRQSQRAEAGNTCLPTPDNSDLAPSHASRDNSRS